MEPILHGFLSQEIPDEDIQSLMCVTVANDEVVFLLFSGSGWKTTKSSTGDHSSPKMS